MIKLIISLLLFSTISRGDELGIRLGSGIPTDSSAIAQFPPGGSPDEPYQGKMVQAVYDWEPHPNFYAEGAIGYRTKGDIFGFESTVFELSPGIRVTAGYLVLKLSEGVAYMPQNTFDPATWQGYQKFDFITHLIIGLRDPHTGAGIYLDRSHYSNGSDTFNPSLNYTGFVVQFEL